jgi:hypothetical protein
MKKLFLFTLGFAIAFSAIATVGLRGFRQNIWYVSPTGNDSNPGTQSQPWQTIAKATNQGYPAGAIIDGMNGVYYEQLITPAHNITIRNLTLDGTMAFDGSWVFVSGNVWKKTAGTTYYKLMEDGVFLNPVICADEAAALASLTAGTWTYISSLGKIYLYTAAGDDPANGHAIRVTSRAYDATGGLLTIDGITNVTFSGVNVRNFQPNSTAGGGIHIYNSSNVVLTACSASNCWGGIGITNSTLVTVTNSDIMSNTVSGIAFQGNSTNLFLMNNRITYNGRVLHYTGATSTYKTDGDGTECGGNGGTVSNAVVGSNLIYSNGPPDDSSLINGSGFYLGTTASMWVVGLTLTNNRIYGNHLQGIYLSEQCTNSTVMDNVIAWNGNIPVSILQPFGARINMGTNYGSAVFANNLVAYNACTNQGAGFYLKNADTNSAAITAGLYTITNNSFYNNGAGSGAKFLADYWTILTITGKTNVIEGYNTFCRVSTWGVTNVARNGGASQMHNLDRIVGSGSGYWSTDTGQGTGDATNIVSLVNPTSLSFTP